jgi:hypothetical protein
MSFPANAGTHNHRIQRVGWAKRSVPTIESNIAMVGTAQTRLCPPYALRAAYVRPHPGGFDICEARLKPYSRRNATVSTRWSARFFRISVARGRVGRMLSSRLARLVRSQIAIAVAVASSSDSNA